MRPRLAHPLRSTRSRRLHPARQAPRVPAAADVLADPPPEPRTLAPTAPELGDAPARQADTDLQRAREAGGPLDLASYVCECGYVFSAPVSTTVHCPHCRAGQVW